MENKFDDGIYAFLYNYWKEHSGEYDPKGNVVASNTANHLSLEYKTENELKFAQWAMREYGMTNKERTTHTFKGQMSVLLEVWNVVDMITLPISLVSAGGKFIGKEVAKEVGEELGEKAVKEVAEKTADDVIETVTKAGEKSGLKTIYEKFTPEEIELLKNKVINEGQMLKDMGLTNNQLGPAIAGVYNKSNGKFYTAINSMDGSLPDELHPLIADRIKNMPDDILLSYTKTHGAGSHAEIYAVNKALLDDKNVNIDDLLIYVNRTLGVSKPVTENPFVTCPHCRYILEGFNVLSNQN